MIMDRAAMSGRPDLEHIRNPRRIPLFRNSRLSLTRKTPIRKRPPTKFVPIVMRKYVPVNVPPWPFPAFFFRSSYPTSPGLRTLRSIAYENSGKSGASSTILGPATFL